MRAAWATRLGPPSVLEVIERPELSPPPGQAVVTVRAASVNFPDVLLLAGKYQVAAKVPYTPGSEFAGVVTSVGDGVDTDLIGRRVMCSGFDGAFAEQTVVPAARLHPPPPRLDDVQAAAFGVAYRTAYHSVQTIGQAREGDTLVVLGAAGGVGLAAVDLGVALGLRVIAAASTAERVALTLERGAAAAIDYTNEDLKQRIKDLTRGRGADVIVDPVGGPLAEAALRASAWGGRFVSVGFASGEIPKIALNLVLLKGVIVRGFEMRTLPDHLPDAMGMADQHLAQLVVDGLRPYVSSIHALTDVAEAMNEVGERRALGKIVVIP